MVVERANAKINVYLNVTGRRENGYHDIVSIMQTVSLHDTVSVELTPAAATQISLCAPGNSEMPTDERNLAWRAAELFLKETGRAAQVSLQIEKRIPMAAGLAGGSADAAAVLRAMNRLYGYPLDTASLCRLGARLGADLPFCIQRGTSLVSGIGDRLQSAPAMPPCSLVLACAGEGVSTPWAYGELDRRYGFFAEPMQKDERPERILQCWREGRGEDACASFFNLFEDTVARERAEVVRIGERLRAGGAITSMMSGSGPSVFGVFLDADAAALACKALSEEGVPAFLCYPADSNGERIL